jgi:ABC-type ATPase involved in cell division
MATHNLELVRQAGHRVLELRDGRLVFDSRADTEGEE